MRATDVPMGGKDMAEEVRRRFTAARASVMMTILGLAAGIGIGGAAAPDDEQVDVDAAAAKTLTISGSKITSAAVKDHSLLYKDFKTGQVVSQKSFKAYTVKLAGIFAKIDTANLLHKADAYVKGESDARYWVKGQVVDAAQKADTAGTAGVADTALKLDGLSKSDLIQGHGSVLTGNLQLGASDGTVMVLIGLLRAAAKVDPQGGGMTQVTLTNTSGKILLVNGDGKGAGSVIAPGGTDSFSFADGSVRPVQVITTDGAQAATLTFSTFGGAQTKTLIGQAIVNQ